VGQIGKALANGTSMVSPMSFLFSVTEFIQWGAIWKASVNGSSMVSPGNIHKATAKLVWWGTDSFTTSQCECCGASKLKLFKPRPNLFGGGCIHLPPVEASGVASPM